MVIPLQPGSQRIYLEWHQPAGGFLRLKGPRVAVGEQAVNAGVSFHMPRNRWILWTSGPPLGPAVLFWTYLLVVILAAIGLGRIKLTPLKTWHWLLLSLGLTQVSPIMAIVIVSWLLVLGVRGKYTLPDKWLRLQFCPIGAGDMDPGGPVWAVPGGGEGIVGNSEYADCRQWLL